jgi:hypothetical protein
MPKKVSSSTKIRTKKTSSQVSTDNEIEKAEIQFLLTEFQEMGQFWRHTDARIEAAINFYLTIVAVFIPGIFLLYQQVVDLSLFVLMSIPLCTALIVVGYFLTRRITSSDILKAKYIFSMNLIRGYFVDNFPHIAQNLHMPISLPSNEDNSNRLKPIFHGLIVTVSNLINSALFGFVVSGIAWLLFAKTLSLAQIILVGSIGILICYILLTWHYNKLIRPFGNKNKHKFGESVI